MSEKAQKSKWSLFTRIVAVTLVIAIVSGLLYQSTEISLSTAGISNKSARLAAMQLLKNDPYANASRLERMSIFARNLLLGERTYEDYDAAVQIAVAQAHYDEAVALNEKALAAYEGDDLGAAALTLRMGYLYAMLEQYQKALEWLDLGIAVLPLAEAVLTRAQVKLNLNDTEGALMDVNACLEAAGDRVELLPDLINVIEAAGQYERAADFWSRLISAGGGADYLLHRAYCYCQMGSMAEAEEDVKRYAEAGGTETGQANAMLGMGFMRAGSYSSAEGYYIRALESGYGQPESLYFYVTLCAYLSGNFERACEYGQRLISLTEGGSSVQSAEIGVENATGMLEVTFRPMDYGTLCRMTGASFTRLGEYIRGAQVLTMALKQNPKDVYAAYLRGSCLLASGDYQNAAADFDACIAAGEQAENSRYSRGLCRIQSGDTPGAAEDFEWLALNSRDPELAADAAEMLREMDAAAREAMDQGET